MKFKKTSYFKNYFCLFILSVVISLSAFSCNESEEIILEEEQKEIFINFVNESDYDLRDLKMSNSIQLPNLSKINENKKLKYEYTCTYDCTITRQELVFYIYDDSALYIDNKFYEFVESDIIKIYNAPIGVYSLGSLEHWATNKKELTNIINPHTTLIIIKK